MMNTIKMVPLNDYVGMRLEIVRLNELVEELTEKLNSSIKPSPHHTVDKGVFVYANRVNKFIKHEHIIMIKAESNYSIIYFDNGNSMFTSKTLKYWEERCKVDYLKRIHKSYIINFKKIKSFEPRLKTIVLQDGHSAFYSRTNKNVITNLVMING